MPEYNNNHYEGGLDSTFINQNQKRQYFQKSLHSERSLDNVQQMSEKKSFSNKPQQQQSILELLDCELSKLESKMQRHNQKSQSARVDYLHKNGTINNQKHQDQDQDYHDEESDALYQQSKVYAQHKNNTNNHYYHQNKVNPTQIKKAQQRELKQDYLQNNQKYAQSYQSQYESNRQKKLQDGLTHWKEIAQQLASKYEGTFQDVRQECAELNQAFQAKIQRLEKDCFSKVQCIKREYQHQIEALQAQIRHLEEQKFQLQAKCSQLRVGINNNNKKRKNKNQSCHVNIKQTAQMQQKQSNNILSFAYL